MCVTDHHDMTLAVKVALNPNTTNETKHCRKFTNNKKYRPMPACACCAGWHGSILFADALSSLFTELLLYIFTVAFMRSNIVGTVIVLSLILWIPASCAVSYVVRLFFRLSCIKVGFDTL